MYWPVIRVWIGFFDDDKTALVERRLMDSKSALEASLRGNLSYAAGIDRANKALVNVSVWRTVKDVQQMDSFHPMLDLAQKFTALGVRFQRPALNFEAVWDIPEWS
jgi:hypothetical protein